MAPTSSSGFILNRLLDRFDIGFDISSAQAFYPWLRFRDYVFGASSGKTTGRLEERISLAENRLSQSNPHPNDWIYHQLADTSFVPGHPLTKAKLHHLTGANRHQALSENSNRAAQRVYNTVEGMVYETASTITFFLDRKSIHENCDLAARAELGLPNKKELTLGDLRRCDNPILASAVDRFKWQNISRIGSAPFFFRSARAGIIANSLTITAERTIFYRPIAFDLLKKAVNDTQINNMDGQLVKDELINSLIRVMEQSRLDRRQPTIPSQETDALRPVLAKIAQDVIDKRFGFQGMLYVMGGGLLIPGQPQQSMRNYEHVRTVGIFGITKEMAALHHTDGAGKWTSQMISQRGDGIAASARPEALRSQRGQLSARGPIHAGGTSNEIGRGAGLGGF